MKYANIYYFNTIQEIGGIEQFFYELSKKYKDKDITVIYKNADEKQLKRLSENIRCIRYHDQKIECEKAFFNFNTDIINNVEADEYCLVVHGNYKWLKSAPPTHPKINKYYAVSQDSADAFTELTGINCEVIYNPLNIEKPKKLVRLVSACRLDDTIKGGARTLELIKKLDEYCEKNNLSYIWHIFTNSIAPIKSKNVCVMKPRIDILPYIYDADYVVQLSDNVEGYCYTVNEALTLGVPTVITPCNVYKEFGIDDTMSIQLDFDLGNIDEVVKNIFEKAGKFKFEYKRPEDKWSEILVNKKSTYEEEKRMKYKVRALDTYEVHNVTDIVLQRVPKAGEEFVIDKERLDVLTGNNAKGLTYVEVVEEIKEDANISKDASNNKIASTDAPKRTTRKKKVE